MNRQSREDYGSFPTRKRRRLPENDQYDAIPNPRAAKPQRVKENPEMGEVINTSVRVLFFLFLLLKPFYIQSSGSIGIADVCLMGCFLMLAGRKRIDKSQTGYSKDFLFYGFLAAALAVNLIYCIVLHNFEFLRYSVFWIYNGCAVWLWRTMAGLYNLSFFKMVNTGAKINILIQYLIWASGRGRLYYEYWGAVRYMGTFNNPLQMAFFLFMMLLLIWMYRCRYGDRSFWLFFILSLPVLADSKSTGIWLGIAVWGVLCAAREMYLFWKKGRVPAWIPAAAGVCLLFLTALFLYWIWPPENFDITSVDYNLMTRLQEKIWKMRERGLRGLISDRAAGRLFLYPQYLLWGAGEGGFERFLNAGPAMELHSTWLSIWFCYGTFPAALMVLWLRKILRANTTRMWCAVIALLTESFFLVNYRQPMFWMILLYADLTAETTVREKGKSRNREDREEREGAGEVRMDRLKRTVMRQKNTGGRGGI